VPDASNNEGGVPLSRVDRVYRFIREAIINGEFEPGSPLRLQELADANDMSLIPVREALRRLEAERLVQTVPNKGARVAAISADDVIDAYKTRIVLEVAALRRAFDRIDDEAISRIREMKDEMVRAFKADDAARALECHRAIHFSLYEQADSPWLLYLIEILWSHTERYRRIATGLHPTYEAVGDEHAKVIEALAARDIDAAAEALRLDLEHTAELIVAAYRDEAPVRA